MPDQAAKARRFLELHQPGQPLLMPNAWDVGSARILAWVGFDAIATTSSGHAAALGRLDGSVSREEALSHAHQLVDATEVPVSADLENGFADAPAEVALTIGLAWLAGLVGASIEDFTGDSSAPIYEPDQAVQRVAAAAEAAHRESASLVLTARCENHLHGRDDLDDTVARLRAYQDAGADVLYAPGLNRAQDIRTVVDAVDRPVNVLGLPDGPSVSELASLGVSRISVGGGLAFAALAELVEAAEELRHQGTFGFLERSRAGAQAARYAFPPRG